MAKIVKTIKIDTVTYAASIVEGPILVDNAVCKGSVEYSTSRIEILEQLSDSQSLVTLMHEIVHALIRERDIDFKITEEEKVVNEMAKGFIQLVRDNPDLMSLIREG